MDALTIEEVNSDISPLYQIIVVIYTVLVGTFTIIYMSVSSHVFSTHKLLDTVWQLIPAMPSSPELQKSPESGGGNIYVSA